MLCYSMKLELAGRTRHCTQCTRIYSLIFFFLGGGRLGGMAPSSSYDYAPEHLPVVWGTRIIAPDDCLPARFLECVSYGRQPSSAARLYSSSLEVTEHRPASITRHTDRRRLSGNRRFVSHSSSSLIRRRRSIQQMRIDC